MDAFGLHSRTSRSGSGRLTISAALTNVALFIHRAVRPPGLHRAETFWNSRSHGLVTVVLWSVPAFLPGYASVDTSLLR